MTDLPPTLSAFAALLDAHLCRTTPARTASRSLPDPVPGIRDGAGDRDSRDGQVQAARAGAPGLPLLPGPHDGRGRGGAPDRDVPRPGYSHTPTHRQAGDPAGESMVNCQ
jgi:hypothetical protein